MKWPEWKNKSLVLSLAVHLISKCLQPRFPRDLPYYFTYKYLLTDGIIIVKAKLIGNLIYVTKSQIIVRIENIFTTRATAKHK